MIAWTSVWVLPVAGTVFKPASLSEWGIIFNWFNLLDCAEIVAEGNYDDINSVQLDTYNAPRIDWGGVLGYYINGKAINFNLIIKKDTETELNQTIDDIKKKLAVQEWLLEININWEYRVGKANLTALDFNRNFENKTIQSNVNISFTLTNHLYASEWESYIELWVTSNSLALDVDNWGTTKCDFKVALVFGAGNSWVDTISIAKDWFTLSISESISDWDLLVIDWVEKQVTLNWSDIDFDWPFRQLDVGSNPMTLNINGTVNVDMTILYNKNYL